MSALPPFLPPSVALARQGHGRGGLARSLALELLSAYKRLPLAPLRGARMALALVSASALLTPPGGGALKGG
jgi:hypothetical protein